MAKKESKANPHSWFYDLISFLHHYYNNYDYSPLFQAFHAKKRERKWWALLKGRCSWFHLFLLTRVNLQYFIHEKHAHNPSQTVTILFESCSKLQDKYIEIIFRTFYFILSKIKCNEILCTLGGFCVWGFFPLINIQNMVEVILK